MDRAWRRIEVQDSGRIHGVQSVTLKVEVSCNTALWFTRLT